MKGLRCVLLGLSRFARRRVIPAIDAIDAIGELNVASLHGSDGDLEAVPKRGKVFRDYEQALAKTRAPALVYISLTNDAHAQWIERALAHGHHVVVDKPAVLSLAHAEHLVALARSRNLVLAEALTYAFHPVCSELKRVFGEHGSAPQLITAAFTPPIPHDDYRHRHIYGGGAISDTGPYAVSIGRLLWGTGPHSIRAIVTARGEVDLAYSMLADYGEGRTMIGHFGFTTGYRNMVHVAGPGIGVEVKGIFSTPPEVASDIVVETREHTLGRQVPPAPAVKLFLEAVLGAITRRDATTFSEILLADARSLEHLRHAANQLA